jgi:hypothetical protein
MNPKTPASKTLSMLHPAPEDWLVADKASLLVNSVKDDGPKLLTGLLD